MVIGLCEPRNRVLCRSSTPWGREGRALNSSHGEPVTRDEITVVKFTVQFVEPGAYPEFFVGGSQLNVQYSGDPKHHPVVSQ